MMEVGEIIRKMSSSGEPYGSLAIVEKIEGEIIIAKYITPPTTDKLRVNIDHVYSCIIRTVQIDDTVLFNITENDLGTYTLEVEPMMSRILMQDPCDLLCLEGKTSKRKVYFSNCHFQALSLPQYIHVYFGSMVYKGR
jgi:hypothetical protein